MDSTQPSTETVLDYSDIDFSLTPLVGNNSPYFKSVGVSLSQKSKSSKKKKSGKKELFYPQWNADNLCYTPAFIIPQDQGTFQKLQNTFRQGYLNNIKNCFDESLNIPNLNLRLPRPDNQHYCGVCKVSYTNFQSHTNSPAHLSNCRKSPFTKHIYDFCQLFGDSQVPQPQDSKIISTVFPQSTPIKKPLSSKTRFESEISDSNHMLSTPKSHSSLSDNIQQGKISQITKLSKNQILL